MTIAIDQIVPITHHSDAANVATHAYEDLVMLLESLSGDDWQSPTDCPAWNVSDMVGHVIGNAKAAASKREMLRQNLYGFRHARKYDNNPMDAYNALQVAEHASMSPAERIAALRTLLPAAVDGRMRTPRVLRAVSASVKNNGSMVRGMPTKANFGHLVDVIFTRDVFMHRIDITRAVGRRMIPGPDLHLRRARVRRGRGARVGGYARAAGGGRSDRPSRRNVRPGLERLTHRDGRP